MQTRHNAARCGIFLIGLMTASTVGAVSNLTIGTQGSTATKLSLFNRDNEQVASGTGGLTATGIDPGAYRLLVDTPAGPVETGIEVEDETTCTYQVDTESGKADRLRCVPLLAQQQQQQQAGWSLIGLGGIKRSPFDADISTLFGNGSADLQDNGWRFSLEGRRQIGSSASGTTFAWGGVDVYSSVKDTKLTLDVHPTPGNDTGAGFEEEYGLRLGIGRSWSLGNGVSVDGLIGVHATRVKGTLITDESGGGGNREMFTDREFLLGPTVGVGVSMPLRGMPGAFLHGRATLDHMPDIDVSGRSSLGFDYSQTIDGGWQPSFQVGIGTTF